MSTLFWKALKLSPAFLGASLLIATSSYAAQSVSEQTAAVNPSQAAATTVEPTVDSLAQRTQTQTQETAVSSAQLSNTSPSSTQAEPLLAQQVPAADNTTSNSTDVLEQIDNYGNESNEGTADALDQVTNVSQLSDVSPGDWAYEALRNLVERYGCIAGYPDGTFRGNRAMTRYEFAAGLNACLQQVERLITSTTANFVTRQDLETLQRLVDEFRSELTALGTRIDNLEGRVAFLEDHQFSTTTKLNGEVIFAISDLFGDQAGSQPGSPDYEDTETVFQERVRLNFDTSFTGKDRLRTRLQAGNITEFGPLSSPSGPGRNITREGRFGFQSDTGNDLILEKLWYRFPVGDIATAHLFANAGNYDDFVPLLNANLDSSGTGAISRFGRYSPIYRMGGQSAGAGLTFGPKSPIRVDLGYLSNTANNPGEDNGIFNGNYSALGQVTFQPSKFFSVAATYVHTYDDDNLRHGTGSIRSQLDLNRPIVGNSYGVEASFSFTPQFVISGWGAYTKGTILGLGDADVWTYGGTLALSDFGTKGSTLGFVVGMEPKLTGSDRTVGAALGRRDDPDTGLHIEGFYRFNLSKNIAITPGVIWLTAPGHNSDNEDIYIGTIRTTFTF
jgi:BMFP domain-containing protein YqiC